MSREEKRNKRLLQGCYKYELAQALFPECSSPHNARRCLARLIRSSPGLYEQLRAVGYSGNNKQQLTPHMVRLIFECFGEPPDVQKPTRSLGGVDE